MNGSQRRPAPDAYESSGSLSPTPAVTPTRRGYAIAAILAVVGLTFGVGGLVRGVGQLADKVDAFARVDAPGHGTVEIATAGDYTLYYESRDTTVVPPFQVLVEAPNGDAVPLTAYEGSFEYSVAGHVGTAVATFHIDSPGTYGILSEAATPAGSAQLAVGMGLGEDFAYTLVPALVMFLAVLAAAIVAIVTAVRRRRAKRQQAALERSM